MRRTSLYESLYLINKGTDTVVQGLDCVQHSPGWLGIKYQQFVLDLQHRCTVLNLQFIKELQRREQAVLQQLESERQQYEQAIANRQKEQTQAASLPQTTAG